VATAGQFIKQWGLGVNLYIKMVSANPAESFTDDHANANRFAETAAAAATAPGVDLFVDTLADTDRSYFVRTGLVDRRFNPRLPGKVIRHLNSVLAEADWHQKMPTLLPVAGGSLSILENENQHLLLVLPEKGEVSLQTLLAGEQTPASGHGQWLDLAEGTILPIRWESGQIQTEEAVIQTAAAPAALRVFK
jgi:hypothetical protein